jgi:PKD repeat protein
MKRSVLMAIVCALTLAVAAFVAEAPASGLAAPDLRLTFVSPLPSDDFSEAPVISALPFSVYVDTTSATTEEGELTPTCVSSIGNTVWYVFNPSQSGSVTGGPRWADSTVMAVYTGTGLNDLEERVCMPYYDYQGVTFYVYAGTSYYIQLGSLYGQGTSFSFYLDVTPPPSAGFSFNPSYPPVGYLITFCDSSWDPVDIGFSSYEWDLGDGTTASGVCVDHAYTAGGTYTVQHTVTTTDGRTASTSQTVNVGVAPPPSVSLYFFPYDPSVFDTVYFYDSSWDPAGIGINSYTWDLGDGTTATGSYVEHKYAADGDYTVQHTVTTTDGRTASASQRVSVRTRDVAITQFSAPQAAKAGQTRSLSIGVASKRNEEYVRVEVFKSVVYGYELVGTTYQTVPVRSGNRTTEFSINYTFTSADASLGKVTFKAVATIGVNSPWGFSELRDVLPADNEAISSPTKVSP